MTRLLLVRHGEVTPDPHADPGLSELGHSQAAATAAALGASPIGSDEPLPIRVSPLRRARETAAPLEDAWSDTAVVDDVIRELPSPSTDLDERHAWIRFALAATWAQLHDAARQWRRAIVETARAQARAEVWVTHYVVINAVVGAAASPDRTEGEDEKVIVFSPANGSITEVDVDDGAISVVRLGASVPTDVR